MVRTKVFSLISLFLFSAFLTTLMSSILFIWRILLLEVFPFGFVHLVFAVIQVHNVCHLSKACIINLH